MEKTSRSSDSFSPAVFAAGRHRRKKPQRVEAARPPGGFRNQLIVGTGTSVGKNVIACALMRISARHGWRVAPFKPFAIDIGVEEKELESAPYTPSLDLQSLATGTAIEPRMNPVWLSYETPHTPNPSFHWLGSPESPTEGTTTSERREKMVRAIEESARSLASDFDFVIAEGSGGVADALGSDIVHETTADALDASVHLVSSFERGGGFAAALGAVILMPQGVRSRLKSVILNRFSGRVDDPEVERFEEELAKVSPQSEVVILPELGSVDVLQEDRYLEPYQIEASEAAIERVADLFCIAINSDLSSGAWLSGVARPTEDK